MSTDEVIKVAGGIDGSGVIEMHPTFYEGQTTFAKLERSEEAIVGKKTKTRRSTLKRGKDIERPIKQPEPIKKETPSRCFSSYDQARIHEYGHFKDLLNELLFLAVEEEPMIKIGRSRFSKKDRLFSMMISIYHKADFRKSVSILKEMKREHLISKSPGFKSLSNFFNEEEFSKILDKLIKISSLPFIPFETTGAIDATGFSTSQFARWFDHKWGKQEGQERVWVKLHAATGCNTNCFLSGEVTECRVADIKMAKDVIGKISKQFKMADFCADKAYNSRELFKFIQDSGMNPYIPFKKNHTGKARGVLIWKVMFDKFIRHNQDFKKHYHQRSNVETNFSMLKERFGKSCRCKNFLGQRNEIKCKMLAVNICLLIQACYTHNISLDLADCVKTNASV